MKVLNTSTLINSYPHIYNQHPLLNESWDEEEDLIQCRQTNQQLKNKGYM